MDNLQPDVCSHAAALPLVRPPNLMAYVPFDAEPGSGEGTLELCNLRALSAPNHIKNQGNNGVTNTVEG